jgi:hypothetical protein
MENQPITNSPETTPINSTPISQPTAPIQTKTNLVVPILLTVLVSAIVFGVGGYYLGKQPSNNVQQPVANPNQPTTTLPTEVLPSPTNTPTPVSLTTYTSSFEKLSFKYPTNWKITQSQKADSLNGDSMTVQSPSGKVEVSWIATLDGLGGSCDPNIPFTQKEGELGAPCPLYEVIEKQKLPAITNLYLVSYLNTSDGVTYEPILAVVDSSSILETKRGMGYLLFKGRNNGGIMTKLSAGLTTNGTKLTKTEAQKFFTTPEALQAKNTLLSATY